MVTLDSVNRRLRKFPASPWYGQELNPGGFPAEPTLLDALLFWLLANYGLQAKSSPPPAFVEPMS